MAIDTSWSTWMKEAGIKTYVRTGLFRRKRTKTYDRFSSDDEKGNTMLGRMQKLKRKRIEYLIYSNQLMLL